MPEMNESPTRWVKIHSCILDHPIWTSTVPAVAKLFVGLILQANWQEKKWWDGAQEITIPRGSLITSVNRLCTIYNLSRQVCRDALENQQKLDLVTIKGTNRWTMITITNYEAYQGGLSDEEPAKQPANVQEANHQQTINKPSKNHNLRSIEEEEEKYREYSLVQNCSSGDERKAAKPSRATWFEEFWSIYPRRVGKGAAQRKYAVAAKTESDHQMILSALRAQLPALQSREKQFIPLPLTWINQQRWQDDVEAPAAAIIPRNGTASTFAQRKDERMMERFFEGMEQELHRGNI
jgi:hypothetical protein